MDVKYHDWKEFIKTAFQPLKGICKFHHFTILKLLPGAILCSVDVDGDKVPVILSNLGQISVNLPPEILPGDKNICTDILNLIFASVLGT